MKRGIKMVYIALLGFGTVGSGVFETLIKNEKRITEKAGVEIQVKRILDLRPFSGETFAHLITSGFNDILNDPEISIVIEMLGGVDPAYTFSKQALAAGKSVITSNKAVVAEHGPELLQLAIDNNCNYLFEASVGGGIPIIRPLVEVLQTDHITSISGILNGTTNYILTQMKEHGKTFPEALAEAQAKGYAEFDPTADVGGHDTCRKIAILSSLVSGKHVDFNDVSTQGITEITAEDIQYATALDYSIKLVGHADISDAGISAFVAPVFVENSQPLAQVNDVFNAVLINGDIVGTLMFYGSGAGKFETASSVVNDIISCVQQQNLAQRYAWKAEKQQLLATDAIVSSYFIRLETPNKSNTVALVTELFPLCKVITLDGQNEFELAYITDAMPEKQVNELLNKVAAGTDAVCKSCIKLLK